ncbi:hypothetical protein GWP57_06515 [Gammaproteobacteria bacterium]|nr:hypothetical protein [Gammaproteobacteria bacterium]
MRKEAALMLVLLFFGLALLPVAIFLVGQNVFGHYGGYGYGHFFGELIDNFLAGRPAACFLVLSPYLTWQLVRLTVFGWRYFSNPSE